MRRLAPALMLALAASALLAAPAIGAPTTVGSAQRVNPAIAGDQGAGGAAMASDGHYWVSYSEQIHTPSDPSDQERPDVYVRKVDVNGVPQGGAIPVNAGTPIRDLPDMAMDANGKFVVVYRYDPGGNEDIKAQRFDANGNPVGTEISINSTTTGQQISHQVAMAPNGKFVVVWRESSFPNKIIARLFNADGSPATGETEVANGDLGGGNSRSLRFPDVDMDSTGKFAVTWERSTQLGEKGLIVYRRYNANGTPATAEKTAFTGETNFNYFAPVIGLADSGQLTIVFQGAGSTPNARVQRVSATDVPAAGTPPTAAHFSHGTGMQIAMDPDGKFLLAWHTSSPRSLWVRNFDASGSPQGDEVAMGSGGAAPAIATDGAGRAAVAWTGSDGNTTSDLNGIGAFTQRINYAAVAPPPPPQCSDGADNDGDGKIDFPADPGCTSASDNSESPDPGGGAAPIAAGTVAKPQCSDGKDNDADGATDAQDPGCPKPTDTNEADESVRDLVLCGRRDVSLVRADAKGRKVTLRGLVSSRFAGGPVKILANYAAGARNSRFTVAKTVKSAANGEFTATVPAPPRRLFIRARYRAQVGSAPSVALKLPQSLASSSVRKVGGEIVLRGKVTRALLGTKPKAVVVKRLVCGRYQTVGSAKPRKSGAYVVRFKAPALGTAALYRAESRVLAKPRSKRYVKQFARAIGITLTGQTG